MFKIMNFENDAEQYKEVAQTVLDLLEKKLSIFSNSNLRFSATTMPEGWTYNYKITSEPLSNNIMGIWALAVQEMKLEAHGRINEDKEEATFRFEFKNTYKDGGGSSANVTYFGGNDFSIVCNLKTHEARVINYNGSLSFALNTLKIYMDDNTEINELIINCRKYLKKDELSKEDLNKFIPALRELRDKITYLSHHNIISQHVVSEIHEHVNQISYAIADYEYLLANTK